MSRSNGHRVVVFDIGADGDVAPKRTIETRALRSGLLRPGGRPQAVDAGVVGAASVECWDFIEAVRHRRHPVAFRAGRQHAPREPERPLRARRARRDEHLAVRDEDAARIAEACRVAVDAALRRDVPFAVTSKTLTRVAASASTISSLWTKTEMR